MSRVNASDGIFMGLGLGYLIFVFAALINLFYGVWLAFSASILFGIISLFVPPSFVIYGLCGFFGKNVPLIIATWLGLPV